MRPQTDDYPAELEQVIRTLLTEGREPALDLLEPIAYPRREVAIRSEPSESVIVSIYKRDRFHCRYCGAKVIPTQIMRLISELFPDQFPYHPNWKGGQTHPAIASRSPSLDHVAPWAKGGGNEPENLVCACWVCNQIKGELSLEQLGWRLRPIPETDWDGLTGYYRTLWEQAGSPTRGEHAFWLRRYETTAPADRGPPAEPSPQFLWRSVPKDALYDSWLNELAHLERLGHLLSGEDDHASPNALALGFRLFPIIDSIASNLLEAGGRRYLRELGYSRRDADLIFSVFRNGQVHNTTSHQLLFEDGEVIWSTSASAGAGNWRPHIEGFDHPFSYEWDEESSVGRAYLRLTGLAAQVRSDLERRKAADTREEVPFIVGRKLPGKVPRH
jgi:hypothetical protein